MNESSLQQELDRLSARYEAQPEGRLFAPLADCYRKLGLHLDALEICRKGLERHPRYPSAHVILGKILRDMDDRDGAREAFEGVLDLDPQNLVALRYLAEDADRRQDVDEARRLWRQLQQLDPGSDEAEQRLERLDRAGEVEVEPLEEPASEAPAEPEAPPVAEEEPEAPAEDEPASPPTRAEEGDRPLPPGDIATITLADIYREQGFKAKALSIYREILGRSPHTPGVAQKVEELEAELERESSEPSPGSLQDIESAPEGEVLSAGLVEDDEPAVEVPTGAPRLDEDSDEEGERFDHFRSWLDRIKVRES